MSRSNKTEPPCSDECAIMAATQLLPLHQAARHARRRSDMNDPQPLVQDPLLRNSWGILSNQGYILGMDIGSHGSRAALIDLHSHTYHRAHREIGSSSADAITQDAIALARELLERHGVTPDRVVRVGVGFAGPVDARSGIVHLSH